MIPDLRSSLATYVSNRLSAGQIVFTSEEAQEALRLGRGAFLDAAERLQRRKHLLSPRRGFYVIVPSQFAAWGAPPPSWYIDALMDHEGEGYYVALLKAAELHGATHQAVMEFQVVTGKRLPKIRAGRSVIAFYYRKDMRAIASGIERHKTDTGTMKISTVELTVLDLLRYPQAAGGIDNIATVLTDVAGKIDASKLAALSLDTERRVGQRLGYLLDRIGHRDRADAMHETLKARGVLAWTELDPAEARIADLAPPPVERNERWQITVRRIPEVDE